VTYMFGMLVHRDTVYTSIKFEGQGYSSSRSQVEMLLKRSARPRVGAF